MRSAESQASPVLSAEALCGRYTRHRPGFAAIPGHAYTAGALFHAQDETIEEALWVAIRALHEKQLLLGRLVQSSRDGGRLGALREYELASEGLEGHKATLRELVSSLRPG